MSKANNDMASLSEGRFTFENGIVFNSLLCELTCGERSIKLAYTESKTLRLLIQHAGAIVLRDQIVDFSWNGRVVTDSSLAKSISNIRKSLRDLGLNDECITTVPRQGYRLVLKVTELAEEFELPNAPSPSYSDVSDNMKVGDDKKLTLYFKSLSPKRTLLLKSLTSILSVIMTAISIYIFWNGSYMYDEQFIATGYKLHPVNTGGRKYELLMPTYFKITDDILNIAKLAPSGSFIFVNKRRNIYSVSYLVGDKASSFTFRDEDRDVASCKIKEILEQKRQLCGM